MTELTHLDNQGRASMVNVGDKEESKRCAQVYGKVRMAEATRRQLATGNMKKGDVLGTARIAGIMAAKQTGSLIPLCHPIGIDSVQVEFALPELAPDELWVRATAQCTGKTGVEMEAMVAASTACLTIYDMSKAVDRSMVIEGLHLASKSGGRSGNFEHPDHPLLTSSLGSADWQ